MNWVHDNSGRMTEAGGAAVAEKRVDLAYNAANQFTSIRVDATVVAN